MEYSWVFQACRTLLYDDAFPCDWRFCHSLGTAYRGRWASPLVGAVKMGFAIHYYVALKKCLSSCYLFPFDYILQTFVNKIFAHYTRLINKTGSAHYLMEGAVDLGINLGHDFAILSIKIMHKFATFPINIVCNFVTLPPSTCKEPYTQIPGHLV